MPSHFSKSEISPASLAAPFGDDLSVFAAARAKMTPGIE